MRRAEENCRRLSEWPSSAKAIQAAREARGTWGLRSAWSRIPPRVGIFAVRAGRIILKNADRFGDVPVFDQLST